VPPLHDALPIYDAAGYAGEIQGAAGRAEINRRRRERLATLRRAHAVDRARLKPFLRPGAGAIGFNGGRNVASAENTRESDRYSADPVAGAVRDASGDVVKRRRARLGDPDDAPGDHHRPLARVGAFVLGDYEINHARAHAVQDAIAGRRDYGDPRSVADGAPFHAGQSFAWDRGAPAANSDLLFGRREECPAQVNCGFAVEAPEAINIVLRIAGAAVAVFDSDRRFVEDVFGQVDAAAKVR